MTLDELLSHLEGAAPEAAGEHIAFGHMVAGTDGGNEAVLRAILSVEVADDEVLLVFESVDREIPLNELPLAWPLIEQLRALQPEHGSASVEGTPGRVFSADGCTAIRIDYPISTIAHLRAQRLWLLLYRSPADTPSQTST